MAFSSSRILLIDSHDSFSYNLAALCRKSIPDTQIHIIQNNQLSIQQLTSILPQFAAVIVGPGPGSPKVPEDIGVISQLWTAPCHSLVPVFGVCLGLQSLAIEFGAHLKRLDVVKHGQISRISHNGTGLFKGIGETHAVRYHSLHVVLQDDVDIEPLAWADDGAENGQVNQTLWAVQYHPESVRTSEGGLQVLQNFWRLAKSWYAFQGRNPQPWSDATLSLVGPSWPHTPLIDHTQFGVVSVTTSTLQLPNIPVMDICNLLGASDESTPFVLLESAAQPGRYSIIGCVDHNSLKLSYTVGSGQIRFDDVWSWLTTFMQSRRARLVGYLGYELGLESMQIPVMHRKGISNGRYPDLNLVFVERSIVVDSLVDEVYIQSLKTDDNKWMEETSRILVKASTPLSARRSRTPCSLFIQPPILRIHKAKEHLLAGDSYELCLTAHTHITVRPRQNRTSTILWIFRLYPSTLISSSPERFLSFTRPPQSRCQLRPIKVAEELLTGSKKEVAENLMIVDLIRHDLHGVVGDDVSVKQFCRVEEYETVWQMVSVIEGGRSVSGLDRSLPPGSMTGAPKKRSVEILQTLEDNNRGIYSGVFGYWDVGGGGDWSVPRDVDVDCDDHETETWTIGAGGAITALSDPDSEWDEMITKLQSVLGIFEAGPR
ncbi:ADC synthase [Russula vinacea]|nr:ADC synthase [Russula vinacea]